MKELAGLFLMLFQASYLFGPILPEQKKLKKGTIRIQINSPTAQYSIYENPTTLQKYKFKHLVKQRYDYSCGSAALTTVLNFYLGENFTELQVMRGMLRVGERQKIIQRQAFSLLDMKRYATYQGYKSAGFRANFKDLKGVKHPMIIPIRYSNFKHFVVLKDIVGGRAIIGDPSAGNITLPIPNFRELWEPNVLFIVYPEGKEPLKEHKLQLAKHDLRFISPGQFNEDILPVLEQQGVNPEQLRKEAERALGEFQHFPTAPGPNQIR